jgi:glutamate N-acetyltransferase / amino-acid N-acetyltransferase
MASGAAGNVAISDSASAAAQKLQAALTGLLQGMAKAVAWDGEGATCLMEVRATGASCEEDALAVAKSVAASSLTKAAIFGHDPNWGRIACAAGYSGAPFTVCGYCWCCCIAAANHFR